jgi:cytochrome c-type biogenesis protein CcmE
MLGAQHMSRKLLVGTVLLGAGILTAVFGLSSPRPVYARSVSAFLAQPIRERTVRVEGTLVPGSLCRARGTRGEYRFVLADHWAERADAEPVGAGPQRSVSCLSCARGDTFRDVPGLLLQVTVEGELCASCHRFEASQAMAKCPSLYRKGMYDGIHLAVRPVPPCAAP